MSDQKSDQKSDQEQSRSASGPEESGQMAESAATDEGRASSHGSPAGRGSNAPAWLALLLALAACGLAGWLWWIDQQSADSSADASADLAALASRVDEQASAIESRAQDLDRLDDRVSKLDSRLGDMAGRLEERDSERDSEQDFDPAELRGRIEEQSGSTSDLRQQFESMSDRLDQAVADLESRIEQAGEDRSDGIDESLAEARFRLGLIEVAGLLRLGQSRAELAADPAGAAAVYRQAQSRLQQLEDGRVERLRQLVGQELEALRSVDGRDWAGLSGRLSALEKGSGKWPLAGPNDQPADTAAGGEAGDSDDGGEQDWWSGVQRSLGGLVRVTPRESAPLTPAAVESVRERVRLHLAAAQAAAARRNTDEMNRQLEAAEQLIRSHFDTSAEAVARALETISSAASAEAPSLPDLGDALAEAERRLAAS